MDTENKMILTGMHRTTGCLLSDSSRCVCVTRFFLFQAMLLTLHPLLSSQLKAMRHSTAGEEGLSACASLCSTGLSRSGTVVRFILTLISQIVPFVFLDQLRFWIRLHGDMASVICFHFVFHFLYLLVYAQFVLVQQAC